MAFQWLDDSWVAPLVKTAFQRTPYERMTWGEDGNRIAQTTNPSMMARMLSGLQVGPGMRVLEIGTGSGYNAALMSELVGPEGTVVTVEVDPAVSESARRRLQENGYGRVVCVVGDGWLGCEAHAPYDRIIAPCKPPALPESWASQLVEGGILATPLDQPGAAGSTIIVYFKKMDGFLQKIEEHEGGFIPMTRTAVSG